MLEAIDPFANHSFAVEDLKADITDYSDKVRSELGNFAGRTIHLSTGECNMLRIKRDTQDLEYRPVSLEFSVIYKQPLTEGLERHDEEDRYYLYPNGIGILRRINVQVMPGYDHRYTTLSERLIETGDLVVMEAIKKKVLAPRELG